MIKKQSPSLVKIVNLLSDGQYHDGITLGEQLKITRSAVWKAMRKLETYHIKIDSIKNKGYALLEPFSLLDLKQIKKRLNTNSLDITIFETINSTNEYLKFYRNIKSLKFCLAEQQIHGKGRLNREWYSPFGQNIYFSCLYAFQKDISELAGLSLLVALAVIKVLKNAGMDDNLRVKWPNDILYDGKKLAGGLIEVQAETHGNSLAIIGLGLNVNMLNDEENITQAWTSMRQVLNRYIDRNELCAALINELLIYLERFNEQGFAGFKDEWMQQDYLANQVVTLKNLNSKITGKVAGINEQGYLLLKMPNGSLRAFSSGDTSIVKKPS